MSNVIFALVIFIILEHLGFLVLEMFLWTKTSGRKVFSHTVEEAKKTEVLAANQGLYNGFLSVGLLWGISHDNAQFSQEIIIVFLGMISIAGIYGGFSAKKSIFYIQGVPALSALLLMAL